MTLQRDLNAVIGEVSALYHERETETRMIATAILARQHVLLLGPPGTGKSAIARELCSRLVGGRYWEILLSKFTSPTEIFGPIDVGALTQGEYRQILDGHATSAHVAFLDEIYKCGPAALNSMLAFLNERTYHPANGDPVDCPLLSAICASNELPEDESTAALHDRIVVRMQVDYLAGGDTFDALLRSAVQAEAGPPKRTTVELAALQHAAREEVPRIQLGSAVRTALAQLRAELRERDIVASDRRWVQCVRLLQAAAWLDEREHVVLEDLAALIHALWDMPDNRAAVERLIRAKVNPDDAELAQLGEDIAAIRAELDRKLTGNADPEALADWGIEANQKVSATVRRARSLRNAAQANGCESTWHDQQVTAAEDLHARLLVEVLGLAPDAVAAGGVR